MDRAIMDVMPVTLDGQHVRLEPLTMAHHAPLAALLDPTLLQWFPRRVTNGEELRDFMEEWFTEQQRGRALPLVTVDHATGQVAGSTSFMNIDRANRRVEIGATWLGRRWQQTALNTEAKLLMLEHAFENWGAIRVELKTDSRNVQSREAIARLGAVEEGYFRNHMIIGDGSIRHTVWFSITVEDWPRVKRQLESRLARR
jgi:RimJ/RimL family protein N-acetyltransferase